MSEYDVAAAAADSAAREDDMRMTVQRLQKQLTRAKARVDDLVAATIDSARDATLSLGAIKPVARPRLLATRGDVEHALVDTGDWQFAKVTTSYNSQVAEQRVLAFADKVVRLTAIQRVDHPVNDCTLVLGGDMVEGLFNFPTQPHEIDATIFAQYVGVSRLLVEFTRRMLANFEHVIVSPEWGNHGRVGSKRDAVPRSDNIDRMCFELARQLLADEPRLTWPDCPEDVQRVEIGNYRALNLHGDEVGRNGFASPQTFVNHVNRWRSGAYAWDFRDVYVHHYHSHMEFPLADGEGAVFYTGSTESDNRYASIGLASGGKPSQRLHFIDPAKGRVTAQYHVWLD